MSKDFVHLHVHSHYSLLESLPKVGQILDQVKEQGGDAVALTDNGALYGIIEFYKKAQKAGIKPIIGMDAYLAPHGHQQRRGKVDAKPYRIVLLAENNKGYKNLLKLSSIGFLDGFYYRPRIDKDLLREHKEGLIALTAGTYGEIPSLIRDYGKEKAKEALQEYLEIFGPEHLYLELVDRPEVPEQESTNATMIELGKEMNIPLVVCKNSFYLHPEDRQAWKILQCVRGGKTLEDYERMNQFDYDASLIAPDTIIERFKDVPEAIENTRKIADRCNVEIELGVWHFPPVDIPEGETADTLLRKQTYELAGKKYSEPLSDEVKKRIDYELDIIKYKEYSGYFISVADYTKWARDNAVVTTTRGSAAGSIVSYIIGISSIDPLEYQLPFERFLNPERPSAPDVDADFADNQRDRVLKYVTEKYGKDRVAQICTFGTMLARGSVRDVGRALGHPYAFVDQIAKQVPMGQQGMPMTLKRAMEENPELKNMYEADGRVRQVIDTARQIEGCARHVSVHAAGVVISPGPLTDYTPLQIDTREGKVITQYEMHAVEDAGLVKMDFLGIRNLSILGDAIKIVSKTKGVDVDIENIAVDDKKTFALLAKGHTMGVFQLSGDGMTKYLVELKPTRVEDIMAMVALYRPGPIEFIPEYIRRKHNPELIDYPHELLEDILKKSLGLLIYQDDVMLTAIKLAGYSWLEADLFRKAMGKKIPELMLEQEKKFKGGCVEKKIPKQLANDLWERIKPFAMYAFNKCITGDTVLTDARSGKRFTVEELYRSQRTPKLHSLDQKGKLQPKRVMAVKSNGKKSVWQVKTRSGRTITATDNHPFLTFSGWQLLSDIKVGDRVGLARSVDLKQTSYPIEDKRLATLGYLIAEGNLCHHSGAYFYSKNKEEINDFIDSCSVFKNVKITVKDRGNVFSIYIGQKNRTQGNELFKWIKELGLCGKIAKDKDLPNFIYQLNNTQLAVLVGKMWQGDGCIHLGQGGQIFYATSSKRLAKGLQHILLRFRIQSTVHTKQFRYRGGYRVGYTIHISRHQNIQRFSESIGQHLIGTKKQDLQQLIQEHPIISGKISKMSARGSADLIPVEVMKEIRQEIQEQGMSFRECARQAGVSDRLFGNDLRRKGYLRETIKRLAQILKSDSLLDIATSDVYWDEILSIESKGEQMTYDLTIRDTHNFLANDFIVHNSHASSYGMVAYQTAYMKANYPAEYMASLMTAESADLEKVALAVQECARMGIKVLPPDINESLKTFTYIDDQTVRFGLLVIKNLGSEVIESMIEERKTNGPFEDLADFAGRVSHRAFNKKSLEAMIKAGALDRFGNRNMLLQNAEQILNFNRETIREKEQNQTSLFDLAPDLEQSKLRLKDYPRAPKNEYLAWEKEYLGLYITNHPYSDQAKALEGLVIHCNQVNDQKVNKFVRVAGMISACKRITTKKGDPMAFLTLQDMTETTEVIVFPRTLLEFDHLLTEGNTVLISAKVNEREGEKSLISNSIIQLTDDGIEEIVNMLKSGNWITDDKPPPPSASSQPISTPPPSIPSSPSSSGISVKLRGKPSHEMIAQLRDLFQSNPGRERVFFLVESAGSYRQIETDYTVENTLNLIQALNNIVGRENVKVD